jgi:hypothetical protein
MTNKRAPTPARTGRNINANNRSNIAPEPGIEKWKKPAAKSSEASQKEDYSRQVHGGSSLFGMIIGPASLRGIISFRL